MKPRIIKASQFKSNPWSGGITSELFIYPETAQYKKSDFVFRLSTATVEASPTIFTPLASINRSLLALKGTMTLSHKGHHTKKLDQFAIDYFDGAW
jgi:environmental stress-induced protein Ves